MSNTNNQTKYDIIGEVATEIAEQMIKASLMQPMFAYLNYIRKTNNNRRKLHGKQTLRRKQLEKILKKKGQIYGILC